MKTALTPEGRPISMSGTVVRPIVEGWALTSSAPGDIEGPDGLSGEAAWHAAPVPGTVAEAIGPQDLDAHPSYDAQDWWYRTSFPCENLSGRGCLRFDGLASIADVWLNGHRVLESRNMFCPSRSDVTHLLEEENELVIAFRSVAHTLSQRRRRPRWKTKLVANQNLRWLRTTLLGRIPAWTPGIECVGPWKPVFLELVQDIDMDNLHLDSGWNGSAGTLSISFDALPAVDPDHELTAQLSVGDVPFDLEVDASETGWSVRGSFELDHVEAWWPRTHGEPRLYPAQLHFETPNGTCIVDLGHVGFRSVSIDPADGRVSLVINGVPVFCRGACWTTNDPIRLTGNPAEMRQTLELAAAANANLVRVGGTMAYETDAFYDACDELGLMVWQDFMFANMDYPGDDESFVALVEAEAEHHVRRLSAHPSVVVWCGGSETEQQAAMFGAPREAWRNSLFDSVLPDIVERYAPCIPYWPSTPTGGVLPFHVGEGLGHYYGVGAYRRPLADARMTPVKFSPECLAFSHIPEPSNLRSLAPNARVPNTPEWKHGVPRDSGAGWDFEDIRDHYLHEVFDADPIELRSQDLSRYLELSRVVTGVIMSQVFDEWRSPEHPCGGALTWFLKDIRPGAGWGILDSDNKPKPVYWHLRRAWSPIRVTLLDRGVDGMRIEIHNETAAPLDGLLSVTLFGPQGQRMVTTSSRVETAPRSTRSMSLEELTGYFLDANYVYRFGPLNHDVISVTLDLSDARRYTTSHWLRAPQHREEAQITAQVNSRDNSLELSTDRPVRSVRLDVEGCSVSDNYFDLMPDRTGQVQLVTPEEGLSTGFVSSLSSLADARIEIGRE